MYPTPPLPGWGEIAGFGSLFLDLLGTNLNGGTWSGLARGAGWALGGLPTPAANGDLWNIQAGQFVPPGSTANSSNPVNSIWRGVWSPSNYLPRVISFQ